MPRVLALPDCLARLLHQAQPLLASSHSEQHSHLCRACQKHTTYAVFTCQCPSPVSGLLRQCCTQLAQLPSSKPACRPDLPSAARCKCDHLKPLSSLTGLTSIELYRCGLTELQALSSLTSLRIARLHANPDVKEVQPLSTLCKLTRLQLSQVSSSCPGGHSMCMIRSP